MFRRFLVLLLLHVAACLVAPAVAEARTGEPCACCDDEAPADDDDGGCCDDDLGACCAAPACVVPQPAQAPARRDATVDGPLSPACAAALIPRATSPPPLPPPIG